MTAVMTVVLCSAVSDVTVTQQSAAEAKPYDGVKHVVSVTGSLSSGSIGLSGASGLVGQSGTNAVGAIGQGVTNAIRSAGLSYEYRLSERWSLRGAVKASVSSVSQGASTFTQLNGSLMAGARWYARGGTFSGFWFEGLLGGSLSSSATPAVTATILDQNGEATTRLMGPAQLTAPALVVDARLGYQHRFKSGLVLGLGVGPELRYLRSSFKQTNDDGEATSSTSRSTTLGVSGEANIGFAF